MFANKVVLITGGSSGIGAATAENFAKEGATIAIVGRNEDRLNEVAQRCKNLGAKVVLTIKADLSKNNELDSIVTKTVDKFDKLDVVVNNAGIFKGAHITAESFLDVFDETMNVNVRGPARITRHAVPHLIKSKGNIVNVSSVAGSRVLIGPFNAYRTSKAALIHFTRCCAYELAEHGVRVNSVSPGFVRTSIFDGTPYSVELLAKESLLNKMADSDEVADLIVYLASDKARSITGSDYLIDNGTFIK